ncbi:uncharacterized protein LOC133191484 [Saccostrea echinata]|uniref:uncharacterized protein LOC133191484 n=1 Tax=Saccostrea echinata TaxID=191078 RepID=UPI002A835B94|nr:uncharacterized protein LOC133191484 [Saccostrea echinata]XP_061183219.1 uncharacterized protein LOC133191484 [Saccostrea echinata]
MSTSLAFFYLLAAHITISVKADAPFCSRLHHVSYFYAYCYQESIYTRCKNTCGELLLDKKYVLAGCPWGNNANILSQSLDQRCREKITSSNCFEYCVSPLMDKIKIGWECCKDCVRVCGKMPPRDINFQQRYPTVYPKK